MLRPSPTRLQLARVTSQFAAGGAHTVVFFGGSITNGSLSSSNEVTSWRALVSAYLTAAYPLATFTFVNAAVGGTGSWYGLTRLVADVTALAPTLVIIDFAANDATNAWDQPSAEALVRRLRTLLPTATLFTHFNIQIASHASTANLKQSVNDWWRRLCLNYQIPFIDVSGRVQRDIAAGKYTTDLWFSDNIHPLDFGHAYMGRWISASLAPRRVSDTTIRWPALATLRYLHTSSSLYENDPAPQNGVDGTAVGTWSTIGTARSSTDSATPATVSFTGTFQSFGLDSNFSTGAGTVAWRIDGGAYTNIILSGLGQTYQGIWSSTTRASHTVDFKVISGTVQINRFLAV